MPLGMTTRSDRTLLLVDLVVAPGIATWAAGSQRPQVLPDALALSFVATWSDPECPGRLADGRRPAEVDGESKRQETKE